MEGAGRMLRHMRTNLGDSLQFGPAYRIGLFKCQLRSQYGVAVRPQHNGVGYIHDCLQEGQPLHIIHRAVRIKLLYLPQRLFLDALIADAEHLLIIMHPLDGRTERSGLVDNKSGFQRVFRIIGNLQRVCGQSLGQCFMKGLAFPVWRYLIDNNCGIRCGEIKGGLAPAGQVLNHRIQIIPVQLRIENPVSSGITASPGDQLMLVNIDGDVPGDMQQRLGPPQDQHFALRLSEGFGK
ncbi:hypothetical protein D3C73_928690 [compost metagenome]